MLELSTVGLLTAFVAGIASFLSPCVLPLVPGYLSYVAGGAITPTASPSEVRIRRWRTLGLSACFVLGFSSVFLILGASITAIGRLFLSYRYELNIAAGVIIALAGIGPVLGSILVLSATSESVGHGTVLLGIYALGLGVPFLLSAFFMTPFMHRLSTLRRTGRYLQLVTGAILVLMGIAVASGQLVRFAIWLLRTFPALGSIG